MTRSQAIQLLEAVGTDEAERLLGNVRGGQAVVDEVTARKIEKLIAASYIRTGYNP